MKRFRLVLVPLAILLLGAWASMSLFPSWDGAADARREIRSGGTLALEVYGLQMGPSAYEDYLTERGVEFRTVADCLVSYRITAHADAFNRVMKDAIRKKLGPDIFEQAEAQIRPE